MNVAVGTDALLTRLEGVQRAGNGWRARCPSCGGTSRKVSITEAANGFTLLHSLLGGLRDAAAIVQAVGLTIADLFPERLRPITPEERRGARRAALHADWDAALGVLAREATVVLIAARMVTGGMTLEPTDAEQLSIAMQRIDSARGVLYGR